MVEASAAGLMPHLFWDYTHRELHALLGGAALRARRDHKLHLWGAWRGANYYRAKRMPDLQQELRRLEPVRDMSASSIRSAVISMAAALGAKLVHKKKPRE